MLLDLSAHKAIQIAGQEASEMRIGAATLWRRPDREVASILGAARRAHWDATATESFTLSGAAVLGWRDLVGGLVLASGTTATRPAYSSTGFAGGPGVLADAVDDVLQVNSTGTLPTGATPFEMWALVSQGLPASNTTQKTLFRFGGTGNTFASINRISTGGFNRARGVVAGMNVGEFSIDFSGPHVVRFQIGATQSILSVDHVSGAPVSLVPALAAQFVQALAAAGSAFSTLLVTDPLSAPVAAVLRASLMSRYGA